MGRSHLLSILVLAVCLTLSTLLSGCARLSIDPASLSLPELSASGVSIFADPNHSAVWIVGGAPHRGESNIAYCTTSTAGTDPECVMVAPR